MPRFVAPGGDERKMARVPFAEMQDSIAAAFVNAGMNLNDAQLCARIHTESSCDGVNSHGVNPVSYTHLDVYKRQIAHPLRRNAEAKTFTIILAADLRRRNISSLIAILVFSAGRLGYLAHARARKLQQMLSGHHSESHATRPSDIVLPPN